MATTNADWKTLFFGPKGAGYSLRHFLIYAFITHPLIMAGILPVILPLDRVLPTYPSALVIAEVVLVICFWGSHVFTLCEGLIYLRLGRRPPEVSYSGKMVRSLIFMFPSMFLGFRLVEFLGPAIGYSGTGIGTVEDYKLGFLYGAGISVGFVAVDLYRQKKASDRRIFELEKASLQAKVSALTAQMNPHLLFNTLNSIAALVHEAPEEAENVTVLLSQIYRRVLHASKRESHRLADEIKICRLYLQIEQARFGDRIHYDITVADDVDEHQMVPVLCLQPFVENAVKHGLQPKQNGGRVAVQIARDPCETGRLTLRVEDDGVGVSTATATATANDGCGTALENCRQRLNMLFGATASVELTSPRHPPTQGETGRLSGGTLVTLTFPENAAAEAPS